MFDEEEMIALCKMIGIDVVPREENPGFFEEEQNLNFEKLFVQPIEIDISQIDNNQFSDKIKKIEDNIYSSMGIPWYLL